MPESLELSEVIPASPERIYRAWLDSEEHSAFTGGEAVIDARVGGRHTAWDGYIQGVTVALEPGRRIVQTWRTGEFPPGSADSQLEVLLEAVPGGTRVTLLHTNIPDGQAELYREGWVEFYFTPMKAYFSGGSS